MQGPPPPPPPSGKPKKRELANSNDNEKWKFDAAKAQSTSIYNLKWENAIGYRSSESGSEGVVFVGWEGDKVVVVKGSSTGMADVFAHDLGSIIEMPFPKLRFTRWAVEKEFIEISRTLEKLDELKKESERGRISKMLLIPIFLIMEYCSGKDMYHIQLEKEIQDPKKKEKLCVNIGKIVMFDVFINNWDRFPLIWDHEGNLGNFLFTENDEIPVVGIDQSVLCLLLNSPQCDKYLEKVRKLLEELISFKKGKSSPLISKMREFLKTSVMCDIGEDGIVFITKGMIQCALDISNKITDHVMNSCLICNLN